MKESGICINCVNKGNCGFSSNLNQVVNFCEEYELASSPEKKYKYESDELKDKNIILTSEYDYGESKGLCMNCEDKEICSVKKTHSGLQFCESYL